MSTLELNPSQIVREVDAAELRRALPELELARLKRRFARSQGGFYLRADGNLVFHPESGAPVTVPDLGAKVVASAGLSPLSRTLDLRS